MWDAAVQNFGAILSLGLLALAVLALAGLSTWRQHQAVKMEMDLKMEMLARGMAADEIERVLAAKPASANELAETRILARKVGELPSRSA